MYGAEHIGIRMMELFFPERLPPTQLSRYDNKFPLLISLYLVYNFFQRICGSEHTHFDEAARKALKFYKLFFKFFLNYNKKLKLLKFYKTFKTFFLPSKHLFRKYREKNPSAVKLEIKCVMQSQWKVGFLSSSLYHSNPKFPSYVIEDTHVIITTTTMMRGITI